MLMEHAPGWYFLIYCCATFCRFIALRLFLSQRLKLFITIPLITIFLNKKCFWFFWFLFFNYHYFSLPSLIVFECLVWGLLMLFLENSDIQIASNVFHCEMGDIRRWNYKNLQSHWAPVLFSLFNLNEFTLQSWRWGNADPGPGLHC